MVTSYLEPIATSEMNFLILDFFISVTGELVGIFHLFKKRLGIIRVEFSFEVVIYRSDSWKVLEFFCIEYSAHLYDFKITCCHCYEFFPHPHIAKANQVPNRVTEEKSNENYQYGHLLHHSFQFEISSGYGVIITRNRPFYNKNRSFFKGSTFYLLFILHRFYFF